MALSDWIVEIGEIEPHTNRSKNPLTGLEIDPEGLTTSRVHLTLTHTPSGRSIARSDLFSNPSEVEIRKYAAGVIAVAEANMTVQRRGGVPSPLKGRLVMEPAPPPAPEPTVTQRAGAEYASAKQRHESIAELLPVDDPLRTEAAATLERARQAYAAALKADHDAPIRR